MIDFPKIKDADIKQENSKFVDLDGYQSRKLEVMMEMMAAQNNMVNKMMEMAKR